MVTRAIAVARAVHQKWLMDDVTRLAAAVTFFGLLALAPLLLLVALLAQRFSDPARVQQAIARRAAQLVGPEGAEVVRTVLENSDLLGSDPWVVATGAITLLLGASNLVVQLQRALNEIWDVSALLEANVVGLLLRRLAAAGLVLVVALLLMLMPVLDVTLGWLARESDVFAFGPPANWLLLATLTALGCGSLFKWLPDARVAWRDVAVGAVAAAVLFTAARAVMGRVLGSLTITSAYAAAGSLVVVLLWTYVAVLILFLAAEVTQLAAALRGEPVTPLPHAVARQHEQERRRDDVRAWLDQARSGRRDR